MLDSAQDRRLGMMRMQKRRRTCRGPCCAGVVKPGEVNPVSDRQRRGTNRRPTQAMTHDLGEALAAPPCTGKAGGAPQQAVSGRACCCSSDRQSHGPKLASSLWCGRRRF